MYNRNRSHLYGRVKVRTKKSFDDIKQHMVEWLRRDLHWIKSDYIQATRISNIGLLIGSYNAIDMWGTRDTLERVVYNKIGQQVKLDLCLRHIKCKIVHGKSVTTNVYSVAVDSRKVSKTVKRHPGSS